MQSLSARPSNAAESQQWNYTAGVAYAVATPVFEGPFDLLLHLILRDEVDLYSVRLSAIVYGYLA